MSLMLPFFCISARHPGIPAIPASYGKNQKRKRLQKIYPRRDSDIRFYSCTVANPHLEMKSYISNDAVSVGALNVASVGQLHLDAHPQTQHPNASDVSVTSIYSISNSIDMASEIQQGRRSKTPVLFVGQLEGNSLFCGLDQTQALAEEYQAVLPLRLRTSFLEPFTAKRPTRLRKIKSQLSLRDVVKQQSQCSPSTSTPGSDDETLVGSPLWRQSPISGNVRQDDAYRLLEVEEEETLSTLDPDSDFGLDICTELLTADLASSLLRHQPAGHRDRASGLQILHMIEAYEGVRQHVQSMLCNASATGKQFGHVKAAEGILEHWLRALHAVYDRSQEDEEGRNPLGHERSVRNPSLSSMAPSLPRVR